jgi:hypothetical protein
MTEAEREGNGLRTKQSGETKRSILCENLWQAALKTPRSVRKIQSRISSYCAGILDRNDRPRIETGKKDVTCVGVTNGKFWEIVAVVIISWLIGRRGTIQWRGFKVRMAAVWSRSLAARLVDRCTDGSIKRMRLRMHHREDNLVRIFKSASLH